MKSPKVNKYVRQLMQAHHDDGLTDLHAFPMSDEEKQFEELRREWMEQRRNHAYKDMVIHSPNLIDIEHIQTDELTLYDRQKPSGSGWIIRRVAIATVVLLAVAIGWHYFSSQRLEELPRFEDALAAIELRADDAETPEQLEALRTLRQKLLRDYPEKKEPDRAQQNSCQEIEPTFTRAHAEGSRCSAKDDCGESDYPESSGGQTTVPQGYAVTTG